MTTPAKPTGQSPQTAPDVLFVGPARERSPLVSNARVVHVPTVYDAIGEIAAASSRRPYRVLVVHAAVLDQLSDVALHAVRDLDRNLTLALLRENGHAERDPRDGFDRVLTAPLDPERLDALLEPDGGSIASPPPPGTDVEPAGRPQRGSPPLSGRPRPHGDPLDPPGWPSSERAPAMTEDRSTDGPEVRSSSPEPEELEPVNEESAETGPLGDTDLVRAIMELPGGVRETAVALLREQTGWNSLTLTDPPKDDDNGAIVGANGRVFGELRAEEAGPDALTPWAEWLAYWLELDRTYADFRHKAYHDALTGAWNRRYFVDFLEQIIAEASRRRRPITLMVFDIDDFKQYNDRFGHAAGDEILRETVRLLNSVIRSEDRVCRIGGDEFAVIFADLHKPRTPGSEPPQTVDEIAQRFQEQICAMRFPKLGIEAPGTLSISAGLATYPWDGDDPIKLLRHADELALQSKTSGKNAITLGPGARRVCGRPRQED